MKPVANTFPFTRHNKNFSLSDHHFVHEDGLDTIRNLDFFSLSTCGLLLLKKQELICSIEDIHSVFLLY